MSIIRQALVEWLRGVCERFFFAAVRVTVEEVTAELEAGSIVVKKRRFKEFNEALDYASQFPVGQDKLRQRAHDLYQEDLLAVRSVTDGVLSGRIPYAEAGEALREIPPSSGSSETSLPDNSKPDVRQALTGGSDHQGGETQDSRPEKRGRGRPKGSGKSKPEAHGNGQKPEPSPRSWDANRA